MFKFNKKNRNDRSDFDFNDDYTKSKKDIKKDMNRRKEKHIKNALRSRDIDTIIEEEEFE